MFEEKWDIFDNHSQTRLQSDSDETGSNSSADEHSEIEPLLRTDTLYLES